MAATRRARATTETASETAPKTADRPLLSVVSDETGFAPITEVRKFIKNQPVEYLLCRERNHPWDDDSAKRVRGGYERVLICPRCGAKKHQKLDRRCHVISDHIEYPEGYLNEGGGRIDTDGRDLIRMTNVKRQLNT